MEAFAQLHSPALDADDMAQATRLLRTNRMVTQDEFVRALAANRGAGALDIFSFRKPRNGLARQGRKNASSLLVLNAQQHAVMYALAGCMDVMYVMSRVNSKVRKALEELCGINKQAIYLWFKNRAPVKRKLAGKLAATNDAILGHYGTEDTPSETADGTASAGLPHVLGPAPVRSDGDCLEVSSAPTPSMPLGPFVQLHNLGGLIFLQQHPLPSAVPAVTPVAPHGARLSLEASVQQYHNLTSRGGMSGIQLMLSSAQPIACVTGSSGTTTGYLPGSTIGAPVGGGPRFVSAAPTLETLIHVMRARNFASVSATWPSSCSLIATPGSPSSNVSALSF